MALLPVAILAACAASPSPSSLPDEATATIRDADTTATTRPAAPVSFSSLDATRRATVADIQSYWGRRLPDQGTAFHPIAERDLFPFNASSLPPPCALAKRVTYDQLRGNAYFCPSAGYIAWDEGEFLPRLDREIGPAASKLVLAHEWGHAVQQQLGLRGTSIVIELQADCLAGMWVRQSAQDARLVPDTDVAQALAGLLQLSDGLDVTPDDPTAHGSAFDRTQAFRDGYENDTCFSYADHPPTVAALDIVRPGPPSTIGFDEAMRRLPVALNDWYARTVLAFRPVTDLRPFDRAQAPSATCDGMTQIPQVVTRFNFWLCPGEHYVLYNAAYLRRVFDGFGIGGLATALAVQWDGLAAGYELGAPSFTNLAGIPFRECFAGAFLRDTATRADGTFPLTVAELNGAVGYIVYQPDVPNDPAVTGLVTSFLALRSFENGIRSGTNSCRPG